MEGTVSVSFLSHLTLRSLWPNCMEWNSFWDTFSNFFFILTLFHPSLQILYFFLCPFYMWWPIFTILAYTSKLLLLFVFTVSDVDQNLLLLTYQPEGDHSIALSWKILIVSWWYSAYSNDNELSFNFNASSYKRVLIDFPESSFYII